MKALIAFAFTFVFLGSSCVLIWQFVYPMKYSLCLTAERLIWVYENKENSIDLNGVRRVDLWDQGAEGASKQCVDVYLKTGHIVKIPSACSHGLKKFSAVLSSIHPGIEIVYVGCGLNW